MTVSAADLKVTFTADTKDAEKGIRRVDDGLKGFIKHAAAMGTGVLGAMAFRGIARGFMNGAAGALDFGAQMANVNSIAQLTDAALAKVSDSVMAIAANPAITQAPAELASGLYDVYSSGFQGADALNVLEKSALAATAGITTTATAARAITSVINAFGLTAGDAGHVSDVLFQTVNDGVITFEQLANNLGNTIPIANALGLGIEDVGAAYAQMTLKGVNASAAETQIASLMRSALNPTDALTTAVQAHGYASAEAAIRTEGLSGFLKILNDASGGSETALMDLLGTQEAMNAATILGADGVKGYTKELNKMKHASDGAGATNKALEKQMKSASFAIAKMKQTVQQLAVVGFGILAPVITKAAGAMTSFLSKGVIPFTKIIGSALKGGFAFDKMIKQLPQPLRRAAHALGSIAEAAGDMWRHGFSKNEMLQALHGVQALGDELGQAVHWAANIVLDGVIALAGDLKDAAGGVWQWLKGKIMGAGPTGDATGGPDPNGLNQISFGTVLVTAAIKLGGMLADIGGDLWGWLKRKIMGTSGSVSQDPASPMFSGGGAGTIGLGSILVDAVIALGGDLKALADNAAGWIKDHLHVVHDQVIDIGNITLQGDVTIKNTGGDAQPGKSWVQSIVDGVYAAVGPIHQAGLWVGTQFFTAAGTAVGSAAGAAADIVGALVLGIVAAIKDPAKLARIGTAIETGTQAAIDATVWSFTGFGGMVTAFYSGIATAFNATTPDLSALRAKGADMIQGIVDGFNSKIGTVTAWLALLPSLAQSAVGDVSTTLAAKGSDIVSGFYTAALGRWSTVSVWFGLFGLNALNAVGDLTATLAQQGTNIVAGFYNAALAQWVAVTDWASNVGAIVAAYVGDLSGVLYGAGYSLVAGFANGIAAAGSAAIGQAQNIVNTVRDIFSSVPGFSPIEHVGFFYGNKLGMGFAQGIADAQFAAASAARGVLGAGMGNLTGTATIGTSTSRSASSRIALTAPSRGTHITINALKSAELIRLIKKAENGDAFARGLGKELGLAGGF